MDVLFVPHNAYHTRNLASALPHIDAVFLFVDVEARHGEGTSQAFRELGLPSIPYHKKLIPEQRPRLIVVMNDWGGWPADLVRKGRSLGIPTAAVVEGVQDFTDSHIEQIGAVIGGVRNPYQHVEFPLLIGEYDRKFITNPNARVVGCARFDDLFAETPRFPDPPIVCINSNFTYGLYTDVQESWLRSAIHACGETGAGHVVTKHHADCAGRSPDGDPGRDPQP